jgi:TP901 family phage tail tape measure protein
VDEFKMLLQIGVDILKSRPEIDKAIKELQKQAKIQAELKINSSDLKKTKTDLQGVSSAVQKIASDSQRLSKLNSIKLWAENNSKAMKVFGSELDQIYAKLNNPNLSLNEFKQVNAQFQNIKLNAREAGLLGKSLGDSFKSAAASFTSWITVSGTIMYAVNSLRKMKEAVFDVDTAMTNLYKVTDETSSRYTLFLKNANKSAQELGQSVSNLVEQTANWAKLGYSIDQASQLAKVSSIYANVGEVDNKTAVSDLVTALKAFNIESSKSITIVDSLNKLGNEFATDAGSLGEGLKNAASALALGGMDINKSLALLTGGSEITQNAGELGNALKVGQMRVMGMKGALEQLGEESEGLESISKIQTHILNITKGQVNIMNSADPTKFKDYYTILEDVSKVYSKLDQTKQADLLETLFGKQRGNQGAAVIQAFQSGQVQKALEASINSAGSAYEEQSRWMQSLEAKTQQYEASFQSLSQTILNSDFLKGLVDSGTTFNNVLNSIIQTIGLFPAAIGAVGIGAFVKNFEQLKNASVAATAMKELSTAVSTGTTNYSSLAAILQTVDTQTKINIVSQSALSKEQKVMALTTAGVSAEEINAAISTGALTTAQTTAKFSTIGFTTALKGLWTTMLANPLLAVGMAVTAGIAVWNAYKQSVEDMRQKTSEATSTFVESSKSIDDNAEKYKALHDELTNANTTEERQKQVKEELLNLQKDLNDKYGEEHGKINLVTDAYKDQTQAIRELNKETAQKFLNENTKGLDDAENQMTSQKGYNIFGQDVSMYSDQGKDILDVAKRLGLKTDTDESTGSFTIRLKADPTSAYKQINDFMNEVTLLQEKYGKDDSFITTMLGASSSELNKAKAIIDDFGEKYNSRLIAEIQAGDNDKLSEGYIKAKNAVDEYNDSVASGDESKIQKARSDLNDVKNSIDLTSDEWKRYGSVVTDVFAQADTKVYDFVDALKSNQNGIMDIAKSFAGTSKENLLAMADDGVSDNFDKLVDAGKAYGLTVEDIISSLEKLKIVQDNVTQSSENVFTPLSKQEVIANINSLSEGFESLDKIMNSMQGKNPFDYSLLDDTKFKKVFGDLGDSYTAFIEKVSSSPKDIKGTQSAFNDLVTEWIDSSGVLNGLTEDNSKLAVAMLQNMGVANAEEVVTSRLTIAQEHLAAQKAYTADMSKLLSNATADEIPKLIDEATQGDIAKVALAGLAIEKANVNGTALDTSGDIENIIALTGVIGSANSALKALNILKSGGNVGYGLGGKEGYDAVVSAAQKEVDDAIKAASEYKGKGTSTNASYSGGTKTNNPSSSKEKTKKETEEIFDWVSVGAEKTQKNLDRVKDSLDEIDSWKSKNDTTDELLSGMSSQLEELRKQANVYQSEADKYAETLNASYVEKIKNGSLDIEKITDDLVAKNVKGYQDMYEKAEDFRDKIDDVKKSMKELAQSKLDNIIKDFDSLISLMDARSSSAKSYLELKKELGEETTSTDYNNLINQQEDTYNQLQKKYSTLERELSKAVSTGTIKYGSDEWNKYNKELIDVNNSMNDIVSNMNDFRKSMIDLPFDEMGRFNDELNRVSDGYSTLLGLIGDGGLTDNGAITSKGLAKIAILGQQYTNAKQQVANYAEEIRALEEAYSDGTITQTEYNDKLSEFTSAQNSSVQAVKQAQDAIVEFRKTAIQEQIDDYNKLIEAKKKALQEDKSYADYLDEVAEKQKNISTLQAKIDELSTKSDASDRSAIAMRLQLEDDLTTAKKDLAKTQSDYAYDQTTASLDKQAEDYANAKNKELDELESSYDAQQKVVEDYLGQVKDNYKTVYNTLTQYGESYNLSATEDLVSPWESAGSAVDTFQSAMSDAIAQINIDLASIDLSSLTELVSTMNGFSGGGSSGGFEDITGTGTWRKDKNGDWYGASNDDYASDGIYTIGGKQYSFNEDGYMKTGWNDDSGEWRYFEPENGQMVKSTWRKDSKGDNYYLRSDGTMATNAAIKDKSGNGYYYVGDDGAWDGKDPVSLSEVKRQGWTIGYKNGTLSTKDEVALMDEDGVGSELMNKQGTLMQFKNGDAVFDSAKTKALWEMADDYNNPSSYITDKLMRNQANLSSSMMVNRVSQPISIEINKELIRVDGNADEKTLVMCSNMIVDALKNDLPKYISYDRKNR